MNCRMTYWSLDGQFVNVCVAGLSLYEVIRELNVGRNGAIRELPLHQNADISRIGR